MKRSQHVRLALSGVVASALWMTGCQQDEEDSAVTGTNAPPVLSTNAVYSNNEYVSGVGYYHAPYGGWYSRPFNTYLPGRGYFHGGDWWPSPYTGPISISSPRPEAVESANVKTAPFRANVNTSATSSGISSSGGGSSGSSSRSWNLGSSRSGTSRGGFGGSGSSSSS